MAAKKLGWFSYFLGTPQRAVRTMIAIAILAVLIQPGLLATAVERLIAETGPLMGPVLTLVLIWTAFKFMIFGRRS